MSIKRTLRALTLTLISVMMLATVACGLRIQRKDQAQPPKQGYIPARIENIEEVQVTFQVQIPEVDLTNVELALDILDDLSVFQDNIKRYPMRNLGDNRFEVSMNLPEGVDIRYRYTMISPAEVPETTSTGQLVQARMALIEKDMLITDTISNWTNSAIATVGGTISGYFKDYESAKGIPDLLVNVAGMQTFTDMTGYFMLNNVPEGTYALFAYAVVGNYQLFQQEAIVKPGLNTDVNVNLKPLEKVKINFQITPPNETVGVPIRLAGNFLSQGANISLQRTNSIAALMPLLSQNEDGSYAIELDLYAGSIFRYRYTIGDAYTNAERTDDGLLNTRQFIVPNSSVTVNDTIQTWRADDYQPVTIRLDAPIALQSDEIISVQVYRKGWCHPIPMWYIADNHWMFLLYGNGTDDELELRFCRNDNCNLAYDEESFHNPVRINLKEITELDVQISKLHNWNEQAQLPVKELSLDMFNTLAGLEMVQGIQASDIPYIKTNLKSLKENGINWIVIRPVWEVSEINNLPVLKASENNLLLYHHLSEIVSAIQTAGMKVSLFPKINMPVGVNEWWRNASRDEAWWKRWYQIYDHFLNNFSAFAADSNVDQLIIDGNAVFQSLPNGLEDEGVRLGTPDYAEEAWPTMLNQTRKNFAKTILWSSTLETIPKAQIAEWTDGLYVLINYSEDTQNAESLTTFIEVHLLPFYEQFQKPVFFGLNLPALTLEALEYTDPVEPILSGSPNGETDHTDLEQQAQLYQGFTCVLKSYDWIKGVSARGTNLAIRLSDFSSSIYGKPAMIEFLNCMNNTQ